MNTTVKMGQDYPNSALDGYSNFFGTSAAAPHAAAVAALIMQGKKKFLDQNPTLTTPDETRSLLQLTAVDMETAKNLPSTKFDYISGYGLVDADSAMRTFAAPTASLIEVVVPTATKPCNGAPFTVTVTGENFSVNTVVYLISGPGDSSIIVPTFINSKAVSVTITSCIGNPEIKAYTAPKAGTNGKDGGFSNSKYFFSAYVTVEAVNITKKYGENLIALDTIIRVNGKLLQDTTLTLEQIGLAGMTVSTAATSISDVGTYAINLTRIFDPTNAADVQFQKIYNYKFTNATVTIAKMPLKVTPDNKTITYGQNIGKVTFKYDFDRSNIVDPASLETIIRNYHEAYLPTNTLAVIKDFKKTQIDGNSLDTTKLRNLNMVASFNAVNSSRKFTLSSNNTLVPVTDVSVLQNNLNVQYLLDVASESIFNYSLNPSKAKFFSSYPGINAKAVLGAAAMASEEINSGLIEVPGTAITSKVLNGTLAQTVSGTGGPVVPIVAGSLVQIADAEIINPASNDLAQYINGQWYTISSDASGTIFLNKVTNLILRGANGLIITVDGVGSSLVSLPGGTTSPILTNAILRGANGAEILVTVNSSGIDVPVLNGSLIQMENGDLVQFSLNTLLNTFTLNVISNGIILRGANGAILRGANGAILRGPNGAILRGANGAILRGANGAILRGANGAILRGANGVALGADVAGNNTGVILDSKDAVDDGTGYSWLGSMFGVNMITGLNIGKQYLVPGVLVDPNFDISYGLGEVDISQAPITVTAAANTKVYDGNNSAAALPTITSGSLAGGDVAVFSETYDNKNQGTGKTINPAVTSIVDALGTSMADNYMINYSPVSSGTINALGITVTAVSSTKTYDGTASSTGVPTYSLLSGDLTTTAPTQVFNDKNVGTGKTLTASGLVINDGNSGNNYLINYSPVITGTINELGITVTAVSSTKTYDGTTSSSGVPTYSLLSGDVTTIAPTQVFNNKNVGSGKTLTASGLVINDGNGGNNYTISYSSASTGIINALGITVTAVSNTKTYDGTASSTGVPTYSLLSGDVTTTAPTQVFNNKNVGTGKTLTASGLVINDGNSGNNYTISYSPVNTGTINALAITVSAVSSIKTYDGTASSTGVPTYSLLSGDVTTTTPTQVFNDKNVGTGKTLSA